MACRLGAIVARASVMDWPSGSHASTFGGNPVACSASLATIDCSKSVTSPMPSGAAASFDPVLPHSLGRYSPRFARCGGSA